MGLLDLNMTTPEGQGFNSALMRAAAMLLTPRSRGGGFGAALTQFPASMQQAQQQGQRNRLLGMQEQQLGMQSQKFGLEMDEYQRKIAQDLAQRQMIEKWVAGLPPEQQAAARLAPTEFIKSMVPQPPKLETIFTPDGKEQKAWVRGPGFEPHPVGGAKQAQMPWEYELGPDGQPRMRHGVLDAKTQVAGAGAMKFAPNFNTFPRVQDEIDKRMGQTLIDRYDKQLVHAPAALDNIEKAKRLAKVSGGFVGSFGDKKLEVVQFLNNNLGLALSPEQVQNASELRSRVFMGIMENLKKMDAQPSQYQQQVMQDALGRLTTDPGALPRVLDVFGDIVRSKVKIHNDQVDAAGKSGIRFAYPIRIDVPPKQLPDNYTASSLERGARYELPDGRVGEWDGFRFKVVQ